MFIHGLRRNRKLWAWVGIVAAAVYTVALAAIYRGQDFAAFIPLSIGGFSISVFGFFLGMWSLSRPMVEGSLQLLLSIPVRGRTLLGARLLATAIPLALVAAPGWIIERTRVAMDPAASSLFRFTFYLQGLGVIDLPYDAVAANSTVLLAGDLLVLGTITFTVIVSIVFGLALFLVGRILHQIGFPPLEWFVPLLVVLLVFPIWSIRVIMIGANLLPWPAPLSCSGWFFGIQECTIATSTIVLAAVIAVILFWLAVRLWDRRLEAQ